MKTVAFKPLISIEHEYKLGYCIHFSVYTITLSGMVAAISSPHSFRENSNNRKEQITTNPEDAATKYKPPFFTVSANNNTI